MPEAAPSYYFAFGSNLSRNRLEQRLGACEVWGVAWLPEYQLCFHKNGKDGSGKCDVFHQPGSEHRAYGVVYVLSDEQLVALDGFEGPGYRREIVLVYGNEQVVSAATYIAKPDEIEAGLKPYPWYKAFVEAGAREHRLPEHYIADIAAIDTIPDLDQKRVEKNRAILLGGR